MGARITVEAPATILVEGVTELQPVQHAIMPDRLEAGSLLLAAAITGGDVHVVNAHAEDMHVFLLKLEEMGHTIIVGEGGKGIRLIATQSPKAVSFKTSPYPGFPTDLQAPTMAALCLAEGVSVVEELVFENRLVHIRELQKMGAQISVDGNKATITGVDALFGANVIASDIRASCALVLAGLVAKGTTHMSGIHHWKRGYDALEAKLRALGGHVEYVEPVCTLPQDTTTIQSVK
jgi:UDP-N-acetylglucosamine 1-carboxyvinyltransferase